MRGAIEALSSEEVSGWLYSAESEIHGARVLALSGNRCIGLGTIGLFRDDLRVAGFGHGKYGFRIPIDTSGVDIGSVVVRLEGSALVLMHRDSRVVSGGKASPGAAARGAATDQAVSIATPLLRPGDRIELTAMVLVRRLARRIVPSNDKTGAECRWIGLLCRG